MATRFDTGIEVQGNANITGNITPLRTRTQILAQEPLAVYPIKLADFRVWDAVQTNLPGTSAADDIGLSGGTWAAGVPKLTTGDVKTTTVNRYGRVQVALPVEYEAGQTVVIRIHAGMLTTISDGSATVDVECYLSNKEGLVSGSDLCVAAAQSINAVTPFTDKDFQITATSLVAGDELDIRIKLAVVDTATATAVIADIGSVQLLCDIRG